MPNVDIIMLSFAKNESLKKMTQDAVDSLFQSEEFNPDIKFNCLVVESNNDMGGYQYRGTRTIYPNQKFGFHKFLNIGIKETNSEYVCLVNNDLIFESGWCTALLEAYQVLCSKHNTDLISLSPFDPILHPKPQNIQPGFQPTYTPAYVPGYRINKEITGWCLFHKRKLYEIIGDLDERYSGWYSDNDFSMTLQEKGIPHYLVLNSSVRHLGSSTINTMDKKEKEDFTLSQYKVFYDKWFPRIPRPEISIKLGDLPETVGVGITTYNRPDLLKKSIENLLKFTDRSPTLHIIVSDDSDNPEISSQNRKTCEENNIQYLNNSKTPGVAFNKNNTLFNLQFCDYIFLLDDDIYPTQKGWMDIYIDAHKKTGIHHLIYNPFNETVNPIANPTRLLTELNGVKLLTSSGGAGALLFLTKKCLKYVGGMNTAYGRGGHEHTELSHRISNFGFNLKLGPFVSPYGEEKFLYSLDFSKEAGHVSTMAEFGHADMFKKYWPLLEENKNKRLYIDLNKSFKTQRVPKIIHQICLSDTPGYIMRLMADWRRNHPEWKYMVWDEALITNSFLINYEKFDKSKNYEEKINIVKYEILNKFGGVFLDSRQLCINRLPEAILNKPFILERFDTPSPGVSGFNMASEPGSRYLEEVIMSIRASPQNSPIDFSRFLTSAVQNFYGEDLSFFPQEFFAKKVVKFNQIEQDKLRIENPNSVSVLVSY